MQRPHYHYHNLQKSTPYILPLVLSILNSALAEGQLLPMDPNTHNNNDYDTCKTCGLPNVRSMPGFRSPRQHVYVRRTPGILSFQFQVGEQRRICRHHFRLCLPCLLFFSRLSFLDFFDDDFRDFSLRNKQRKQNGRRKTIEVLSRGRRLFVWFQYFV